MSLSGTAFTGNSRIAEFERLENWDKFTLFEVEPGRKLQKETWTQHGTYTNVWYLDLLNEGEIVKVEEDGKEYAEKFSISDCNGSASSFYFDEFNKRLYVHTSGGDNPAALSGPDPKYNIVAYWWVFISNRNKVITPKVDVLINGNFDHWHKRQQVLIDERSLSPTEDNLRNANFKYLTSQSFKVTRDSTVDNVCVWIKKINSPTGNMWCEIHSSQVGTSAVKNASANVVGQATDNIVINNLPSGVDMWLRFEFNGTQPALTANTTYYLVLYVDYSPDGTNYINVARTVGNYYSGGSRWYISAVMVWTEYPAYDLYCCINAVNDNWEAPGWTRYESGTSTVSRETTEIVDRSAYSLKLDIDASNNDAEIFRDDIVLKPGRPASIEFIHKESASGKTLKIKLRDSGANVGLDENGEWVASSNYISISNATDWNKITLNFVAHPSYSSYRLIVKNDSMASAQAYIENVKVLRWYREVQCKPWLPEGALPTVSQSVGFVYTPDEQISYGTVKINNAEGYFWDRRYLNGYLWHGKKACLKLGLYTDSYEDLIPFFTGVTRSPVWGEIVTIDIEDERSLFSRIPTTRFDSSYYPNCEDSFKNTLIPVALGEVEDVKLPQCDTTNKKFKVSETYFGDGVNRSIWEVYNLKKNDTALTEWTDYIVDHYSGEIIYKGAWSSGDELTVGEIDGIDVDEWGDNNDRYKPASWLYFLYVTLNGVSPHDLYMPSFKDLYANRQQLLGEWLYQETGSIDFLINLVKSSVFQTVPRLDGRLEYHVYKSDVPSDAPHYRVRDFRKTPPYKEDTDQCFKTVTIYGGYQFNSGYFEDISEKDIPATEWNHRIKENLELKTYLQATFQCDTLAINYSSMVKNPPEIIEDVGLPISALLLNPCEKFYLTYSLVNDDDIETTIYTDQVFRVLQINKDLNMGEVSVVALKDDTEYFWVIS